MVMLLMESSGLELLPHARGLKMLAPKGPVNEFREWVEEGKAETGTHDNTEYECPDGFSYV